MRAQDLFTNLELRGFSLSLVEVNGELSIAVDSPAGAQLTADDRWHLRANRTELINQLRPSAPEASDLAVSIESRPEPRIENGELIIPLNTEMRYRYWIEGGQSIFATLAELGAPLEVWAKYAGAAEDLLSDGHSARCKGAIRKQPDFAFCVECGYYCETERRADEVTSGSASQ